MSSQTVAVPAVYKLLVVLWNHYWTLFMIQPSTTHSARRSFFFFLRVRKRNPSLLSPLSHAPVFITLQVGSDVKTHNSLIALRLVKP